MQKDRGLDKLLHGQYDEALEAFCQSSASPQAEKLCLLTKSLTETKNYAAELAKGNLSVSPPASSNAFAAELKTLHMNLRRLSRQMLMATAGYPAFPADYMGELSDGLDFVMSQATTLKRRAEYDKSHDSETGLLNRKAFVRSVRGILQEQPDRVGILFCCELDNIKYINDAYGYDNGDLYLNRVAEVLAACAYGTNFLARMAGNEFAVYAHGFNSESDAFGFAQGCMKTLLNTRIVLRSDEVWIRASSGAAVYPHDALEGDILMNCAYHAQLEVKSRNRGTLMRFSPEIYRTKANTLGRQEKLNELLDGKLLRFAFQPIVNLRNAHILGYEALMRPTIPDFSSPLDVLALAENQSKLFQLEKVTFEIIFEWIHSHKHLLANKKIFFNTISTRFLNLAELREIHPQCKAICKKIVFEILETATVESSLAQQVKDFRTEMSTQVALDDFGCGHSNILRLINLSPDILKIDRFFIKSIHDTSPSQKELLSGLLNYCRAKGILTLAEGVETSDELASVIRMGFDYAQGFYLGRPEKNLNELEETVRTEILDFHQKFHPHK
ncbi:MAG: bifunctional diguanylate cyclase/phosphodiesterase [Desulfovibrio sp.]|nr:bifunctional diguanylate cyclase/phosphodiesterase [Desulfovibrio sp.]